MSPKCSNPEPGEVFPPLVSFDRVSLRFRKHNSIFELFLPPKDKNQDFWALKEISFTIKQGETLGIIGRNGSGKSTLSLVCTGVYLPDKGSVDVKGKVQLLALGVGFQNQMTGRENVFVSGSLLGLKKTEIRNRMDEIEAFADIGHFMDEPVRTYSSGMRSRLAFAIATATRPDILILDEIMATGDDAFKEKAMERMKNLHSMAKCAIVVSHSPPQLKELCSKVLWLEKARVVMLGEPDNVLSAYQAFCRNPDEWKLKNPNLFFDMDVDAFRRSGYFRYHLPRYEILLDTIHKAQLPDARILEIGQSRFSQLAWGTLGKSVDTLGSKQDGKTATGFHYQFDLNDAHHPEKCRTDLPKYEIIVFAEELEYLQASLPQVLRFLKSLLSPDGIIILQASNALALHKRLNIKPGRNQQQPDAPISRNLTRFRDYTMVELSTYLEQAGFSVLEKSFENYFDYRYLDHANGRLIEKRRYRLVNMIYAGLPARLRPGLCVVASPRDDQGGLR